jgi:hypothetical protein
VTVAGIDFSSHAIDVVTLDEDTDRAEWHRFPLTGSDAFDRARAVRAAMPGGSFWDDVLACGIEQTQMRGSGMAAAYSLYRVQGAVLACLPARLLVQPLIPSAWRKAVGIPGNAKKAEVYAWALEHCWQPWHDGAPQDAMDAYCIALATRTLLQHGQAAA